jgi:preprotein translocase subunit SecF
MTLSDDPIVKTAIRAIAISIALIIILITFGFIWGFGKELLGG